MLNALKQLMGLAPRDDREVWHAKPVVILDSDRNVAFSGIANVAYTPDAEKYENGLAEIDDFESGDLVMSLRITGQRAYSNWDPKDPYRQRWSRLGITAKGLDADGKSFTLFVGRHASAITLRQARAARGEVATADSPEDYLPEEMPE